MVVGFAADMGSRHEAAKLEVGPDWKWSMIREHDIVVLTKDLPEEDLAAGDAGTDVHVHPDNAGYEVEFMTLGGQTIAVITAFPYQLRCITRRDIVHVRELAVA